VDEEPRVRTIAIINQKGGCGKTTTAINLAGVLASAGKRTLLVDLDPQSHCAAGLAIPEQRLDIQIGDAMLAPADAPLDWTRLLWRISRSLDLIPSSVKLAGLEAPRGGLAGADDAEKRLDRVLLRVADQYDICLIDCSPSIGLLTFNALVAAQEILIPVETAFFALQGASKQVSTIKALAKRLGVSPSYRILPTMHDPNSPLSCDVLDEVTRRFEGKVAPTVIRFDQRLREAASFGQPVIEYAPESVGAEDYLALGRWVLDSYPAIARPSAPAASTSRAPLAMGSSIEVKPAHLTPPPLTKEFIAPSAETPAVVARPSVSEKVLTKKPAAKKGNKSPQAASADTSATSASVDAAAVRITELATQMRAQMLGGSTSVISSAAGASIDLPPPSNSYTRTTGEASAEGGVMTALATGQSTSVMAITSPDAALEAAMEARRQLEALNERTQDLARRAAKLTKHEPIVKIEFEPEVLKPNTAPRTTTAIFGVHSTSMGVLFVQPASLGKRVSIAGTFNNWQPHDSVMRLNEELGVLELTIPMSKGDHQYRLIVDGNWMTDPHNPYSVPNEFGTLNSIATQS
jgi:chromosome partitioning protein